MDGAKKPRNTMMALIARLVVAAYLLYTAWELRGAPAAHDGAERVLFIVAIVAIFPESSSERRVRQAWFG